MAEVSPVWNTAPTKAEGSLQRNGSRSCARTIRMLLSRSTGPAKKRLRALRLSFFLELRHKVKCIIVAIWKIDSLQGVFAAFGWALLREIYTSRKAGFVGMDFCDWFVTGWTWARKGWQIVGIFRGYKVKWLYCAQAVVRVPKYYMTY